MPGQLARLATSLKTATVSRLSLNFMALQETSAALWSPRAKLGGTTWACMSRMDIAANHDILDICGYPNPSPRPLEGLCFSRLKNPLNRPKT